MRKEDGVSLWRRLPRWLRRSVLFTLALVLGSTGAVLLVLPGPGVPLLFLALTLLALEFTWAEVLLHRLRSRTERFTPKNLRVWCRDRKGSK